MQDQTRTQRPKTNTKRHFLAVISPRSPEGEKLARGTVFTDNISTHGRPVCRFIRLHSRKIDMLQNNTINQTASFFVFCFCFCGLRFLLFSFPMRSVPTAYLRSFPIFRQIFFLSLGCRSGLGRWWTRRSWWARSRPCIRARQDVCSCERRARNARRASALSDTRWSSRTVPGLHTRHVIACGPLR